MQIKITRERGWFGAARALGLYVDGKKIGQIRQNQSETYQVPSGSQELWGKMDWGRSPKVGLTGLQDGAHVTFKAYFTLNPLKLFAITGIPFKVTVNPAEHF